MVSFCSYLFFLEISPRSDRCQILAGIAMSYLTVNVFSTGGSKTTRISIDPYGFNSPSCGNKLNTSSSLSESALRADRGHGHGREPFATGTCCCSRTDNSLLLFLEPVWTADLVLFVLLHSGHGSSILRVQKHYPFCSVLHHSAFEHILRSWKP
jgi:hypothetical protein